MNFDLLFPLLALGVFAFVAGPLLIKYIKHGGLKGAMFGARIVRTVGEVSGHGSMQLSTLIKVHTLTGGGSEKAVGLEFVAKSFASHQMMPLTMSVADAKKLISPLESAVHGH